MDYNTKKKKEKMWCTIDLFILKKENGLTPKEA